MLTAVFCFCVFDFEIILLPINRAWMGVGTPLTAAGWLQVKPTNNGNHGNQYQTVANRDLSMLTSDIGERYL